MKYWLLIFLNFCLVSSVFAEYRVDSFYPKSGVVGQDLNIQVEGKFGDNSKAVLYPSKEAVSVIGSVKIPYIEFLCLGSIFVKENIAYVSVASAYQSISIDAKTYIVDIRDRSTPQIINSVNFFILAMTEHYALIGYDDKIGLMEIDKILTIKAGEIKEINRINNLTLDSMLRLDSMLIRPFFFLKRISLFFAVL